MKKLGYCGLTVALVFLACGVSWADELYLRNRPFKGYAANVGRNLSKIEVDLKEFCSACGWQVVEVDGNRFIIGAGETPDASALEGTGQLFFKGKVVKTFTQDHREVINLSEFADLCGGRLVYNAPINAVDFNLASSSPRVSSGATAKNPPVAATVSDGRSGFRLMNFFGNH